MRNEIRHLRNEIAQIDAAHELRKRFPRSLLSFGPIRNSWKMLKEQYETRNKQSCMPYALSKRSESLYWILYWMHLVCTLPVIAFCLLSAPSRMSPMILSIDGYMFKQLRMSHTSFKLWVNILNMSTSLSKSPKKTAYAKAIQRWGTFSLYSMPQIPVWCPPATYSRHCEEHCSQSIRSMEPANKTVLIIPEKYILSIFKKPWLKQF